MKITLKHIFTVADIVDVQLKPQNNRVCHHYLKLNARIEGDFDEEENNEILTAKTVIKVGEVKIVPVRILNLSNTEKVVSTKCHIGSPVEAIISCDT